jgi:putative transposase
MLFRSLDKQPLADTLDELQAEVDALDRLYNTQRSREGLPGRITPHTAWEPTLKADPPRRALESLRISPPLPSFSSSELAKATQADLSGPRRAVRGEV